MKTTVVGSYPVPDWLKASPNEATQADAIALTMRAQERAGIDVISDGELGRWDLQRNAPGGMVERFARPMEGVATQLTRKQLEAFFARSETAYRKAPPGIVTGPLGSGTLDLKREWERSRALTDMPLKFTVTSPYMLARVVADEYYGDLEKLAMAFADVLAEQLAGIDAAVVQVDEPNLPGSPEHGEIAVKAINRVLDAVEGERAVHICFGNYRGQTIQQGHYAKLIGFFNEFRCDHLVMEVIRRPWDEIEKLKEIRPEILMGLGVIDVKDMEVETAEEVCERIEKLVKLFGVERIAYVHPDCGLTYLPREIADGKLRALAKGYKLFVG